MKALRILLVLLCIIGATVANAETCTGPSPATNGSQFYVALNSSGFAVLWYCKKGSGWEPDGVVGHWSELPGDWLYQVPKYLYGTDVEREALRSAEFAKPQPDYSNTVTPLMVSLRRQYDLQYKPPGAVTCRVPAQSASEQVRTYYKANKAGTGIGAALGKVPAATPCDASKRLGATNYYWVPSVGGYAIGAIVQ